MHTMRALIAAVVFAHLAGVAGAQTDWVRSPEAAVLELASPGAWDEGGRLVTTVVKVDGVYHMFFKGWRSPQEPWWEVQAQIGHATSSDGIEWQLDPANPVLRRGDEQAWDHASLEGAAAIHDGSGFRMWYAAVTPSELVYPPEYVWHGLGYATSPDGSSWTKHPANPIVGPGTPGILEGRPAVPQTVIVEDGLYRMWFTDPLYTVSGVGYAESDDGLVWRVHGPDTGATLPSLPRTVYSHVSVVPNGDLYYMFITAAEAYPWDYLAASRDGIRWSMWARGRFWLLLDLTVLSDNGVLQGWSTGQCPGDAGGIYRWTSGCCSTVFTWILPAAADGPGAAGSSYRTEVVVTNADDVTVDYLFAWLPRGETRHHRYWTRSRLYSAPPRTSVRFSDVLAEVFGLGPGSFGALAVEASSDALLAMARISSRESEGVVSQAIPILRVEDFTPGWGAERRRIVFGSGRDRERFNLVCQAADLGALIKVELYDDGGTHLETRSMTLGPWSNGQLNRVFDAHSPVFGHVEVWSETGAFYCFGSLLDNLSSDAITIPPM